MLLTKAVLDGTYENSYWLPYKDFLDVSDNFTEFSCERLEGKEEYISLIENLLHADETAQVFVEVYGLEQDQNDQWIYGETLIIFSQLSIEEIKQILNKDTRAFPSEIGRLSPADQKYFIINESGSLAPALSSTSNSHTIYYCWWD